MGVAAAVALLAPAAASAASAFTWTLASDFTATGSGANPDHDQYGATPWTYVEGPASLLTFSHDPSQFSKLASFATNVRGGLAGWSDPSDASAFIGINPTDAAIVQAPVSYPAHTIAIEPPPDRLVAVGWTSPFAQAETVTVSGAVTSDDPGGCLVLTEPQWSLDQDGTQLQSGTPDSGAISQSVNVPAGGTIYLTVTPGGTASCSNVAASLTIQASGPPPSVTLASPAQGAVIAGGQPTFSGSAGQAFGDSPQVTVRVYSGSSASGSPLQTLTTTASGGSYQVQPTTGLADGTYTAEAEQDDVLSPPVAGLSAPVTFTVANGGPKVTLASLGSKPLRSGEPTITGTASTGTGDTKSVTIAIFAGQGENGKPIRLVGGSVSASGAFSVKITPSLPDGLYTAAAAQKGPNAIGISQPETFEIKASGPAVGLSFPASGANVPSHLPLFTGTAGTNPGDSSTITVTIYKGASAHGKPVGRQTTTVNAGKWLVQWTRQLPLGLYTAQASQSDNAGHLSTTPPHRFLIVPGPRVIGSSVSLSRSGKVSVPLSCYAPASVTCQGNLLIVTQGRFRPASGGPAGRLRLLFRFVRVPGGKTIVATGTVSHAVARIVRRHAPLKVEVSLALQVNGKVAVKFSGGSTLRVH